MTFSLLLHRYPKLVIGLVLFGSFAAGVFFTLIFMQIFKQKFIYNYVNKLTGGALSERDATIQNLKRAIKKHQNRWETRNNRNQAIIESIAQLQKTIVSIAMDENLN